ncbi:MAG: energy transducer TonB [Thermoanaerobaculia bacterium]
MEVSVDQVLSLRSRRPEATGRRWKSFLTAVVLHAVLASSFFLVPLVGASSQEPFEFVAVQIVPVQALGVQRPEPTPPADEPAAPEPQHETVSLPEPTKAASKPSKPEPSKTETEPKPAPSPAEPKQRMGSPTGSSLGTSAFGAAVGGLDNPDFVYSYYIDQMLALISANWLRPSLGSGVEAVVYFRINRDGQISDVRIIRSSGYNSFDLAGLRAVQLAAPFPRFPQSYSHDTLGVNLILR